MITTFEISELLNGELVGDPNIQIHAPSKIEEGGKGTITFLSNPKYNNFVYSTTASAILVDKNFVLNGEIKSAIIKVDNVYHSLSILLNYYNNSIAHPSAISPQAIISDDVKLGKDVAIHHFTVVSQAVSIGDNSIIYSNVFLGNNVVVGKNCIIYPGVKIYHNCTIGNDVIIHANTVIGSDGFGFAKDNEGQFQKMPQLGKVILEDNVEVGANTVIDRGSLGDTIIKAGVKIDNLVQIAHNVCIEKNTAIAAQTGIAGSTKVGMDCLIGGQVGLVGHITVADGAMIQAKSGISSNVKEKNAKLYGYPALNYNDYLKSYAYFKRLPDIVEKLRQLEIDIQKIKENE